MHRSRSLAKALPTLRKLVVAALLGVPGVVMAQGPTGPAIPMGADLKKVAIGSWSEYTLTAGKTSPMKQRFALVGKDSAAYTLELTMAGGPMPAGAGRVTMRVVLDSDLSKPDRIKQLVMQFGDNDPMQMPTGAGNFPKEQFGKIDPKKLVGKEEIKVPAGTFKTSHYRDNNGGNTFEYWINEDVAPFGLVKLQGTMAGAPAAMGGGGISMTLAARGAGAKPQITKAARAFDPAALMGQMGGGSGQPPPGPQTK